MKKNKITIKIDAEYGSGFQQKVAESSLASFLVGWTMFYNYRHQKNHITYDILEEDK